MKKIVVFIIAFGVFVSCKDEEKQLGEPIKKFDKIKELHWLIGNWTNITEEEQSYENWSKLNDSTLFAHSFTLVESDTVFAEHMTLQQNKNEIFLKVVAYSQNDNKPITFTLNPAEIGVFTFENPDHDFPTKISYSNPVKDSIHAWIEGTIEGELRKIDFRFKRD